MSAKIAQALHSVMSSVGYIQRTGKNDFHKYSYASETDLLEKLRPAMLQSGLLLIPSVQTVSPVDEFGNTHVQVAYTLAHKDGDVWPDKIVAAGCGNDKAKNGTVGDKGVYKALTGANKYLLFKLFQVATGDDPESDSAHDRGFPTDVDESVKDYLRLCEEKILTAKNPTSLKTWWESEKNMRDAHGLKNGTPEYTRLFSAFKERGLQLSANTNILLAG